MNRLIINVLYFSILLVLACGYSDTDQSGSKSHKKDPTPLQKVSIGECIKNILYIKESTEIEKYDSLATYFFHELEEYVEPEAISLSKQIDSLKKLVPVGYELEKADFSWVLNRIDSLRHELSPYKKFVVGYAFVHTFFNGKDTVSAIFVMDTLCGFGEMTITKEVLKFDPIDNQSYSNKIKKHPK